MDRRWLAVLALGLVLGSLGLWWGTSGDPVPPRPVRVQREPSRLAKPARAAVRASLPPPVGIDPPTPPRESPEPATISPDDRMQMNVVVDEVLRAARSECLAPWLAQQGDGEPAEFVFDAVLYDGRSVDVGLRSMRLDLPSDVVQCVADRTWYAAWPEWELPGELRLQRAIEVRPAATP